MKKRNGLLLLLLLFIFTPLFFGGCGMKEKKKEAEPYVYTGPVDLWIHVILDRMYVKSMSEDDPVWKILMGPFGSTRVYITGSTSVPVNETVTTTFKREINWGSNSFHVQSHTCSEINFMIQVEGKRTGTKEIGRVTVGNNPRQTIVIEFNESGSSIR